MRIEYVFYHELNVHIYGQSLKSIYQKTALEKNSALRYNIKEGRDNDDCNKK